MSPLNRTSIRWSWRTLSRSLTLLFNDRTFRQPHTSGLTGNDGWRSVWTLSSDYGRLERDGTTMLDGRFPSTVKVPLPTDRRTGDGNDDSNQIDKAYENISVGPLNYSRKTQGCSICTAHRSRVKLTKVFWQNYYNYDWELYGFQQYTDPCKIWVPRVCHSITLNDSFIIWVIIISNLFQCQKFITFQLV